MSANRGNRNSQRASNGGSALDSNPYLAKAKATTLQFKDKLDAWLSSSDNFLGPYLDVAQSKTKVDKVVIFLVAVGVIVLYLLFGAHAGFLSHIITFVYPALGSLRALETRATDDDTKWLTYWVVFGFLGLFEHLGETLLSVLPFYYVVKTGFQLWLCLPGIHNGSLIIYERFLRPVSQRFLHINMRPATRLQGKIDSEINKATSYVKETTTQIRNDINNKLD